MVNRDDRVGDARSRQIAACVRALNRTIGELATVYGSASVAAALTQVMGCPSCLEDVSRGAGIQALIERISGIR